MASSHQEAGEGWPAACRGVLFQQKKMPGVRRRPKQRNSHHRQVSNHDLSLTRNTTRKSGDGVKHPPGVIGTPFDDRVVENMSSSLSGGGRSRAPGCLFRAIEAERPVARRRLCVSSSRAGRMTCGTVVRFSIFRHVCVLFVRLPPWNYQWWFGASGS